MLARATSSSVPSTLALKDVWEVRNSDDVAAVEYAYGLIVRSAVENSGLRGGFRAKTGNVESEPQLRFYFLASRLLASSRSFFTNSFGSYSTMFVNTSVSSSSLSFWKDFFSC